MPLSPKEQNQRRRDQKRKQSAVARAKAAHKKSESERASFNFVYFGEFTKDTLDAMMYTCHEKDHTYMDKYGIWNLVKDGKVKIRVLDNQHLLADNTITVTTDGFKDESGQPIEQRIRSLIVTLLPPIALSFTWQRKRGQKPKMLLN
jgi:hypothetical protein